MKRLMFSAMLAATAALASSADDLAEYGGEISLWPKDPGLFLFVNAQKRVSADALEAPVGALAGEFYIDMRMKQVEPVAQFDIRKAAAELAAFGAKGGIWIVDDPLLPVSLAATESGWGVLNVFPLLADAPGAEKLGKRLLKFASRLFADIHGASDPVMMPGCVTKQAVGLEGVDALNCSTFSPEATSKVSSFLAKMGYKQKKQGTYLDACEEGWAPAPTNAVQKAIWDKVHQLPTKPLTIKRESERRGKK